MDITNVLFTRRTGKIVPSADPWDNLFGMKLNARDYGEVEKTIDFAPIISVSDALAKPAIDVQCGIVAVQSGTGDPSPQNIRNIVGWNGLTLHVNSSEIPVTWQTEAGTVYGGILNLTTGVLTITNAIVDLGALTWYRGNNDGKFFGNVGSTLMSNSGGFLCSCYKYDGLGQSGRYYGDNNTIRSFWNPTSGSNNEVYVHDDRFTRDEFEEFKAEINGQKFVFPLKNPVTIQLTPTEITLLQGNNTLWNTAGDTKLTYLAKKG